MKSSSRRAQYRTRYPQVSPALEARLRDGGPGWARDREGHPLGGVTFDVALYISTGGHCAVTRSRPLATVTTDAAGDALVPDGDLDYHLELRTPHLAFVAAPDPHARRAPPRARPASGEIAQGH